MRIQVTLLLEVDDLSEEDRADLAQAEGIDADDLESIDSFDPIQVAGVLEGIKVPDIAAELFAGTDVLGTIVDVQILDAVKV